MDVEAKGFTFHSCSLESLFEEESSLLMMKKEFGLEFKQESGKSPLEKVLDFFQGLTTQTSKEDALYNMIFILILKMARDYGCEKILTAETCTHLAIQTISGISQGKGRSLPIHMALQTNWYQPFSVIRPLRDVTDVEVNLYNEFANVSTYPLEKNFKSHSKSILSLSRGILLLWKDH